LWIGLSPRVAFRRFTAALHPGLLNITPLGFSVLSYFHRPEDGHQRQEIFSKIGTYNQQFLNELHGSKTKNAIKKQEDNC
jgi:hypothetical protein